MKNRLLFVLCLFMIIGCELSDEEISSIDVREVDMSLVSDGTFTGEYKDPDSDGRAKVSVTVEDHQITAVDILELNASPVGRKARYIVHTVLEEQSVSVDAVSGATLTSLVILKSIEVALMKGIPDIK